MVNLAFALPAALDILPAMWFKRRSEQLDWLVFGLGNPGINYAATRHNVGWWVLDELARRWGVTKRAHRHQGQVEYANFGSQTSALIKPTTFMNRSGRSLKAWQAEFPEARWLVIADDISLKPGKLRLREQGSAGGHKGLKSMIDSIGSQDFLRLKVGVGQPPVSVDSADYVLEIPTKSEEDAISCAVTACADAIEALLSDGIGAARNVVAQYSQPVRPEETPSAAEQDGPGDDQTSG